MRGMYYFSTHGCRRFGSCFVVGALDELACAAACCRALMLKKSAIVACWGCVEVARRSRAKVRRVDADSRNHVIADRAVAHQSCHHCTSSFTKFKRNQKTCWIIWVEAKHQDLLFIMRSWSQYMLASLAWSSSHSPVTCHRDLSCAAHSSSVEICTYGVKGHASGARLTISSLLPIQPNPLDPLSQLH